MFDHTSRYYLLEERTHTTREGRKIRYKQRRFLPQGEEVVAVTTFTTTADTRLDLLAAHEMGDPLLFWRICDANNALDPADLTAEIGRELTIPLPHFEEPR